MPSPGALRYAKMRGSAVKMVEMALSDHSHLPVNSRSAEGHTDCQRI